MGTSTYHDIVHVILLDLCGKIDGYLDLIVNILLFDSMQERMEPFGGTKVANNPSEVNLGQTRALRLIVQVIKTIPDW